MAYRFAVATTNSSQITPAALTVRLLALLEKVSGRASKKDVHLLRTTVRRLEVQLGHPPAKIAKSLKRLRRKAGQVRDLDVHLGLLQLPLPIVREHNILHRSGRGAQSEGQKELRKILQDRRDRRLKSLQKQVLKATPLLQEQLPALAEGAAPPTPTAADVHRKSALARDQYLQWTRTIPVRPERLHRLRINTKKLRYSLEPLSQFEEASGLVARFKAVQDAIGEWHDWATLGQLAGRFLDTADAELFCTVLAARAERQYRQALRAVQSARNGMQGHKPVATDAEVQTQTTLRRAG